MDEYVVVNFCEARDTVVEWYRRVKSKQGQVEVPASDIFTL